MAIELGRRSFTSRKDLTPGKVVQFTYDGEQKIALVLNPEWQGKMHALSLKAIDLDSVQTIMENIKGISDPDAIYEVFRNSKYVVDRPYRTYLLNKMSTMREIYVKEDTELKTYKYIRNMTSAEINNEVGEYFDNDYTATKFPNLANSREELRNKIINAPVIVLSKFELLALDNSDVGSVLNSKNPELSVRSMMRKQGRDTDLNRILDGIKNDTELPTPIVIKSSTGYYLLGGNSRLSALASLGYTIPVKVLQM